MHINHFYDSTHLLPRRVRTVPDLNHMYINQQQEKHNI